MYGGSHKWYGNSVAEPAICFLPVGLTASIWLLALSNLAIFGARSLADNMKWIVTMGHVTYQVIDMLSLYVPHTPCVVHPCMSLILQYMSVHSSHLQVTPPESLKQRYDHSFTASRLGPGLTKVLVYGGSHKQNSDFIAEPSIHEFGMY